MFALQALISSPHLSLNCKGHWGNTDDVTTSFLLFFPVLHCPLGLGELQACPFPDVVFPPLPLSASSSPPFHCSLRSCGLTFSWWGCYGLCPRHKPAKLAHSFLFCYVHFCPYGPFDCILFHKFSRQLSAFSLCSSGLVLPYWSFELHISL